MENIKTKIEAVLFITGKAMTLQEIAEFCNIGSLGSIRDALQELQKDYQNRESSLEIIEENGTFRLNIKKQYNYLSTKLLSAAELDAPTQATLALVAYKQPILQAEVIKLRGNTAYDHIHKLQELEFIVSEKSGRTRLLKLAPKFFEYFDVVEQTLKEKLQQTVEKQEKLFTTNPKKDTTDEATKEKKDPLIPGEEKKKKKAEKIVALTGSNKSHPTLDTQRSSQEDILTLDADNFGSKC